MEIFWKTAAGILLAAVLCVGIAGQSKDFSLVLSLVSCCMAAGAAMAYLGPVLDFLKELEVLAQLQEGILKTLLQCTGVGLSCELGAMLCKDSGNNSLAQTMHLLGSIMILYLSVPIFREFLALIQNMLGYI